MQVTARILIDALSARQGGGQTYLANLLQCIPPDLDADVLIMAPDSLEIPKGDPRIKRLRLVWPVRNPIARAVFQRLRVPALIRKLGVTVYFVPGGVVATRVPPACKLVTMFRNMIPFDTAQRKRYPLGWQRLRNWVLERQMLKSMKDADLVIFVSEFARKVIETRANSQIACSVTIPHGLSRLFRTANEQLSIPPEWAPAEPFILYVSTLDYYKAQIEVVRAFALLRGTWPDPIRLVLLGPENPSYGKRVRMEVKRLGLEREILFVGKVPYAELPNAYRHATINVFASESENCPNTLLEALGAGRPVICSLLPPMPEFAGTAALYFDPRDPVALAKRLQEVLESSAIANDFGQRAALRAAQYDWEETGRKTWHALVSVCGCNARN